MEPIKLECTYEERISKKDSSKKYKAIFIKINDRYEKMILVSYPEQIMIESVETTKLRPDDFLS
jgi:hypothetical protein